MCFNGYEIMKGGCGRGINYDSDAFNSVWPVNPWWIINGDDFNEADF